MGSVFNLTLLIIDDVFSKMAQVLHVCCRLGRKWKAMWLGTFGCRVLEIGQVVLRLWESNRDSKKGSLEVFNAVVLLLNCHFTAQCESCFFFYLY